VFYVVSLQTPEPRTPHSNIAGLIESIAGMKLKRMALSLKICLLILSLSIARGNDNRRRFGEVRIIPLPPDVIVDEYSAPVISCGGDVAFVSSVMSGALISFSITSGKVLSSVTFGEIAGMVSMVEADKRRLIALPTANDPDHGRPATVSVIDATNADRLERIAVVELPSDAHLTPTTRALLTQDARFGLVASSFNQPALFSFSVETGKINSSLRLPGWPSEIVLYDGRKDNTDCLVAVVSVEVNTLSIIKLDRLGRLSAGKSFSPTGMSFDISNNPAFSADGRIVYVAVHNGEHLFSLETQGGSILGQIKLLSPPQRITVVKNQTGGDLIGITRTGSSLGKKPGVTILASDRGVLTVRTEFTPPESIQFSRANNVVFDSDTSVALVGTMNGILFAFKTKTGELESHKVIGSAVRTLALNNCTRTLVAVSSTPKTDQIVILGFNQADLGVPDAQVTSRVVPQISKVTSDPTQLRMIIEGSNLNRGARVEFVKAGNVVVRQTPVILSDKQLAVTVPMKTVEALGRFELRIATTDKALSNAVTIDPSTLRSVAYAESASVKTKTLAAVRTETSAALRAEKSAAVKAEKSSAAKAEKSPAVKTATLPPSKPATVVRSVRTLAADGGLRVFVETNGEAKFQDFTLTDPSRIVVDIVDVQNRYGNKTIPVDSRMIERVRVGQPRAGVVRVVLDTNGVVSYRLMREGGSLIIEVGDGHLKSRTSTARKQQ
jgi:hypothetical protein